MKRAESSIAPITYPHILVTGIAINNFNPIVKRKDLYKLIVHTCIYIEYKV
jgi:hypothetical protein